MNSPTISDVERQARELLQAELDKEPEEVSVEDNPDYEICSYDASVRAVVAALSAQKSEREEWQDISTAPKDQLLLLAAEFDGPGDWRVKVGGWRDDGRWEVFGASWTPTHWRPLPDPPAIRNLKIEVDDAG